MLCGGVGPWGTGRGEVKALKTLFIDFTKPNWIILILIIFYIKTEIKFKHLKHEF